MSLSCAPSRGRHFPDRETTRSRVGVTSNFKLVHGQDQHINAWVQNTRPIVLQHSELAQQLQASLPREIDLPPLTRN